MISKPQTVRRIFRAFQVALGVFLCAAWLTACEGGGKDRGGNTISVDIRPLVEQMGGSSGSTTQAASGQSANFGISGRSLGASPLSVMGPGNSIATTDVQSLIIGAIAIAFQDTPLGPTTPITDSLKASLKTAAINSVKFLSIAALPTNDPFVEFDIPPPGAVHWQIVVVGTRNSIQYLTDIKDDSPIYYGFNTDSTGNPTFLSTATATATPIGVTMVRACIVSSPPNGCAQYKPDQSASITDGVEILAIYLNGSGTPAALTGLNYPIVVRDTGSPVGTCDNATGCTSVYVASQLAISGAVVTGLSTATSAVVETTHQMSPSQPAACSTINPITANVASMRSQCGSQFYPMNF